MSLSLHEIAEARHRILNPFTEAKLRLLGEVAVIGERTRVLDLACGKGELLCRWAEWFGATGVGVDISPVFLSAAHRRAAELGVAARVSFEQTDARTWPIPVDRFDVACCIGATWIGDGLVGTARMLLASIEEGGQVIIGEPFWQEPPPAEAVVALGLAPEECTSLVGTLDRIEEAGLELVEMVLADPDSWDRYEAAQWRTVSDWLAANPDDPLAPDMRDFLGRNRRAHLEWQRRYLGWGAFVTRAKEFAATGPSRRR